MSKPALSAFEQAQLADFYDASAIQAEWEVATSDPIIKPIHDAVTGMTTTVASMPEFRLAFLAMADRAEEMGLLLVAHNWRKGIQ